ncbi:MAG TPA: gliding motility-associated C-terminal domain-containing protein, partial [Adhaeribacter sp.]|nr:gliding motility-associated C-terminal domain-containing protein [Adhaeribacter sp.]
ILRVATNVAMAIPGATYTVTGGAHPVLTICWKPAKKDLYTTKGFQITARNNACPIPEFKSQYIRFYVVKKKMEDPGPIDVITPQPPALRLAAPNVITPNNDGKNDAFVIQGTPGKTEIQIFDRNKKLVYSAKNYKGNWKGDGVRNGTYLYILKDHETGEVLKGTIEVIR